MKNHYTKLPILLIFFVYSTFLSAQINPAYKIATWQGFATSAVSYTWDDNTVKQLTVAKPLFDKFNFKATFFIVTYWVTSWRDYQAAANSGHEIASHTKSHPNFGSLNETEMTEELGGSKNAINGNLTGNPCTTVAYPFCVAVSDSQARAHYISARTCQGSIEPPTPANMMRVSSILCGNQGSIQTAENFNTKVNSALPSKGWVVFLLHGIDNDGGFSPIAATELDSHLTYMNQRRSDFWVATYENVVKYIRERNESKLVELSNVNDSIVFSLTHSLGTIYNVPVSLERSIPSAWQSTVVMQGNNKLLSTIIDVNGVKILRFNALPNAENITIKGIKTVNTDELETSISKINLYPNPSKGLVNLDFSLQKAGQISIDITNQSGQVIEQITNEKYAIGDYHFPIKTDRLPNQVYYVVIAVDGVKQIKKMLVF
jgi:Polysaccharide deacetylase/Secretion system C-terminal sorting domain